MARDLTLILCMMSWSFQSVAAKEIVVGTGAGSDFATIAQAVKAARPGDTVLIRSGIYYEELAIENVARGAADTSLTIKADPAASSGSVILDGTRAIPTGEWQPFVSETFGVRRGHNIWTARHSPDEDCSGMELRIGAWPYQLRAGGYSPDGGTIRYGTCHLFAGNEDLTLVPTTPNAGLMADMEHADSEETQSHDYITAANPKFLQPSQWIWYDDGRTDGADKDDLPVRHPEELKHRMFVRLPAGQTPSNVALAISVRSNLVRISGAQRVTIEGLHLRRANHTAVLIARSQGIKLRQLTVESFGGGRKFYYAKEPDQHIYDYGCGISAHTSDIEISDCRIRNGTGKGISVWGGGTGSANRTAILRNAISDIGPHPWGGGWAHGRGDAIGTGNACNVLIADNEVQRVGNCGVWVDGGNADSNIFVLRNYFRDIGNYGIFFELGIADAFAARNIVCRARCGFRVGPAARHCRIIGNAFDECEIGGAVYVFKERIGQRRDTIVGLAVAGNQFLRSRKQALATTPEALENPNLLFDGNVYHLAPGANATRGFDAAGRWGSFEFHRESLRASGHCVAADEHSRLLTLPPDLTPDAGIREAQRRLSALLTKDLLDRLESGSFIGREDRRILGKE